MAREGLARSPDRPRNTTISSRADQPGLARPGLNITTNQHYRGEGEGGSREMSYQRKGFPSQWPLRTLFISQLLQKCKKNCSMFTHLGLDPLIIHFHVWTLLPLKIDDLVQETTECTFIEKYLNKIFNILLTCPSVVVTSQYSTHYSAFSLLKLYFYKYFFPIQTCHVSYFYIHNYWLVRVKIPLTMK